MNVTVCDFGTYYKIYKILYEFTLTVLKRLRKLYNKINSQSNFADLYT
jgi:hypothetical protein